MSDKEEERPSFEIDERRATPLDRERARWIAAYVDGEDIQGVTNHLAFAIFLARLRDPHGADAASMAGFEG